jgi:hypothetical protein
VSVLAFDQTTLFPGPNALLPCLGAAGIIYAGQSGTSATAKFLSLPAMRFIGAISYSLYLWHWPVLSLMKTYNIGEVTPIQTACAVLVAFVMAVISWRLVEQPFRAGVRRDKPVFRTAAAVMAGALALSAAMIVNSGLPQRFPLASQRLFRYSRDSNPRLMQCVDGLAGDISYAGNCRFGAAGARNIVAVWGDSHGSELSVALGEAVVPDHSVMQITSSACPPALDFSTPARPKCAAHNRDTLANLVRDERVHTVVIIAHYGGYIGKGSKFRMGFERAIAALVAAHKQVVIVYPVPQFPYPVPDALGMMVARGIPVEDFHIPLSEYRQQNAVAIAELDAMTAKYGLPRVETQEIFCDRLICKAYDGRDVLYWDDNHVSISGARKLAALVKPLLASSPRSP